MNREVIDGAVFLLYAAAFLAAIHAAGKDRYRRAYELLLGAFVLDFARELLR